MATGEASYSSFGPVLALWDVFLHLVCLQFMRKITNQQFLWTESFYVVTQCLDVMTNQGSCPSLYLLNKISNQMKRAPAASRRHSKPNSPLTHFSRSLLQPCAASIHCSVKWLLHITAGHNCTKVCIPLPSETCHGLNSKIYDTVICGAFIVLDNLSVSV